MKLVNTTRRPLYTAITGTLNPGRTSSDRSGDRSPIEKALAPLVKTCGSNFGLVLNQAELDLIAKVMDLDERGSSFDPRSIPTDYRKDPTGEGRALRNAAAAQQKALEKSVKEGVEAERREARINGEVDVRSKGGARYRREEGPGRMKGEKVDPSNIRGGFEAILEENERIAAAKANAKNKLDEKEALDPIGKFAKKPPEEPGAEAPEPQEPQEPQETSEPSGPDAPVVRPASEEDDPTRSANAVEPPISVQDRAGAMDRLAAETARKLSIIGPDVTELAAQENSAKAGKAAKPAKQEKASGGSKGSKESKGTKGSKEPKTGKSAKSK